jgi:hypothetical protein
MKPRFYLKLYKKGHMVYKTSRASKRRLLAKATHALLSESIDKAYLKVEYSKGKINEGIYITLAGFQQAYEAFTSQSLIDYVKGA